MNDGTEPDDLLRTSVLAAADKRLAGVTPRLVDPKSHSGWLLRVVTDPVPAKRIEISATALRKVPARAP